MIAVLHLRLLYACIYDYCTINEYVMMDACVLLYISNLYA